MDDGETLLDAETAEDVRRILDDLVELGVVERVLGDDGVERYCVRPSEREGGDGADST